MSHSVPKRSVLFETYLPHHRRLLLKEKEKKPSERTEEKKPWNGRFWFCFRKSKVLLTSGLTLPGAVNASLEGLVEEIIDQ